MVEPQPGYQGPISRLHIHPVTAIPKLHSCVLSGVTRVSIFPHWRGAAAAAAASSAAAAGWLPCGGAAAGPGDERLTTGAAWAAPDVTQRPQRRRAPPHRMPGALIFSLS